MDADPTSIAGEPSATVVAGPLTGLRVIELGHLIAAPFATRVLADLGAEVIKVESPGGDPVRGWGTVSAKGSAWWSVHGRNKKLVTLDLKAHGDRQRLLDLVSSADAVVENYRPGQLERWEIGPDVLRSSKPDLIVVRISGFGQDGPYRDRSAFGVIGEAMGGIRHLSGYPAAEVDLPPVRVGVSFGDSIAGLYGAIGLLAALFDRASGRKDRAKDIDVALYEAVFSLMEGALPEYGAHGVVRQPTGSALPTVAPSNAYRCADGEWIIIAANSDPIFRRLMRLIGHGECAEAEEFRTNEARIRHRKTLDRLIAGWTAERSLSECESLLVNADIPACRIYTIADCADDPHFRARGMVREITDPRFGMLLHPGVVPKFSGGAAIGGIAWPGAEPNAHAQELLPEKAQ